jgi:hypothetical protein
LLLWVENDPRQVSGDGDRLREAETRHGKLVIIEISDVLREGGLSKVATERAIRRAMYRMKHEGYVKLRIMSREQAEAKGIDMGLNGAYALIGLREEVTGRRK